MRVSLPSPVPQSPSNANLSRSLAGVSPRIDFGLINVVAARAPSETRACLLVKTSNFCVFNVYTYPSVCAFPDLERKVDLLYSKQGERRKRIALDASLTLGCDELSRG